MEKKSIFMAYVFLLFFGTLGFHQFYLGRPYMALAYLLTGGFLLVGVVIDFFTLPAQVVSANIGR
jgi:TM2 domain-containing membrane protein YozV